MMRGPGNYSPEFLNRFALRTKILLQDHRQTGVAGRTSGPAGPSHPSPNRHFLWRWGGKSRTVEVYVRAAPIRRKSPRPATTASPVNPSRNGTALIRRTEDGSRRGGIFACPRE